MDMFTVYISDRLGHYRSLAEHGTATSTEVAARTGTVERYTRELLEQQAITSLPPSSSRRSKADRSFPRPGAELLGRNHGRCLQSRPMVRASEDIYRRVL